jgi:hypothetical protein
VGYTHRQFGSATAVGLGFGILFCAVMLFVVAPPARLVLGCVLALCLAAFAIFHSLSVEVGRDALSVRFGVGWPRRRFPLSEIKAARPVRNSWWYGWGIRMVPGAWTWMWNVGGLDAIELELADGRRFRVGTDDPRGLESALRGALSRR